MNDRHPHEPAHSTATPLAALCEVTLRIDQLYSHWARAQGINHHLLAIFSTLDVHGCCTQKQISETWTLPKQTVSNLCRQLQDEGLIIIESSDSDRREKRMRLSEKGLAHATPILDRLKSRETQAMQDFGEARTAKLLAELSALENILNERMRR